MVLMAHLLHLETSSNQFDTSNQKYNYLVHSLQLYGSVQIDFQILDHGLNLYWHYHLMFRSIDNVKVDNFPIVVAVTNCNFPTLGLVGTSLCCGILNQNLRGTPYIFSIVEKLLRRILHKIQTHLIKNFLLFDLFATTMLLRYKPRQST